MKPRPRATGTASGFFQPRQADRQAGPDFAWPPPAEDLARCEIVALGEEDVPTLPAWGPDDYEVPGPTVTAPPAPVHAKARPRARAARPPVDDCDPLGQFASDPDAPADAWSRTDVWRAAAALLVGVSLAAVSYSQFRGARTAGATHAPVAIEQVVSAADAIDPPAEATPEPRRPYGNDGISLLRGASLPERAPAAVRAAQPARDADAVTITPAVLTTTRAVASLVPSPPMVPSRVVEEPRVEARPLPIAPMAAPEPVAVSRPEPIAVVARVEPSRDEDHIRSTLAQWRTAYSQLDASAARAVWPSVDVHALEKAFQSLKSQELSFDHCNFTVNGARAQAACTGRASYVPRVGNPAPKTNAREWTFELTRSDERWTIASASARSS